MLKRSEVILHHNFENWFDNLNETEKCEHIKKKSMDLHRSKKAMEKALSAELNCTTVRSGVRGGKRTSLVARSMNTTDIYNSIVEELKFMVKKL